MRRWIELGLRLLLAGVFVYAGVGKLRDPAAFAADVAAFRLVPGGVSDLLAVYLPWLEVLAGASLLGPRGRAGHGGPRTQGWRVLRRGGLVLLIGMLVVFTAALLSAAWRGLDLTCGCFGAAWQIEGYVWPIGRNVLLLAGCVWLVIKSSRRPEEAEPAGGWRLIERH